MLDISVCHYTKIIITQTSLSAETRESFEESDVEASHGVLETFPRRMVDESLPWVPWVERRHQVTQQMYQACPSLMDHRSSSKISSLSPFCFETIFSPRNWKILNSILFSCPNVYKPVSLINQSCLQVQLFFWWWCICCSETPSPAPVSGGHCTLLGTYPWFWSDL